MQVDISTPTQVREISTSLEVSSLRVRVTFVQFILNWLRECTVIKHLPRRTAMVNFRPVHCGTYWDNYIRHTNHTTDIALVCKYIQHSVLWQVNTVKATTVGLGLCNKGSGYTAKVT